MCFLCDLTDLTCECPQAPGFIKAAADGTFKDASAAAGGSLVLDVSSATPGYRGFHVSVVSGTVTPSYACAGGGSIPLSRGCFKASFNATSTGGDVAIPLSAFSDKWSPATGAHTAECADEPDACLTADRLCLCSCRACFTKLISSSRNSKACGCLAILSVFLFM